MTTSEQRRHSMTQNFHIYACKIILFIALCQCANQRRGRHHPTYPLRPSLCAYCVRMTRMMCWIAGKILEEWRKFESLLFPPVGVQSLRIRDLQLVGQVRKAWTWRSKKKIRLSIDRTGVDERPLRPRFDGDAGKKDVIVCCDGDEAWLVFEDFALRGVLGLLFVSLPRFTPLAGSEPGSINCLSTWSCIFHK